VTALLCAILFAATALAMTPLDQTETWTGPGNAGWTNEAAEAALTNVSGALELDFASQFAPAFVVDTVRHAIEPGTLLTNIAFRLAAMDTPPSRIDLCLHSRLTGNTWYYPLPVPDAGAEIDCAVPVEYTVGWRMGPVSTIETFQTDVQTVDWVGVFIRRHSDPATQRYALDDFRLRGQSWPEDRDLDGMENDWETRYGLLLDDPRDGNADPDGDGMPNYAEARAGTDPTNAASRFVVHLRREPGGNQPRVTLWWNSVSNRSYTVWRAVAMDRTFEQVRAGLASTPVTNTFEDAAATNADAAFYRVDVEP
jgi:hypothetical protein